MLFSSGVDMRVVLVLLMMTLLLVLLLALLALDICNNGKSQVKPVSGGSAPCLTA